MTQPDAAIPLTSASEPCPWTFTAGSQCCTSCSGWDTASPSLQEEARVWASTFLWAATGRRFNECVVSVRPCGAEPCDDGSLNFYGQGWFNGIWVPYIWNGSWFNCRNCGDRCLCKPDSQIRLLGPVIDILEITLGADIIPADTYWVDDAHWLVRKKPDVWPECNGMNTLDGDDVLTVTYTRGDGIPSSLKSMAKRLACEYVKSCNNDSTCQLSSYVQSVSRAGVDFTITPFSEILASGLTGIAIIDQTIRMFNPNGLHSRPRLYAPELMVPRQQTWPN
jgi:hypothetical protein